MSSLALSLRGLRKTYGTVVAVDGLDLEVRTGECFGFLGPNGAGKTTTIEICEGLNTPDAGEVEVLGRRWDTDPIALRERLGISLQETQLAEKLTVLETLQLFRSFYGRRARQLDEVLGRVQLEEKRRARVGTLSGGQKQRLALACALVGDPELLFLDEPTTGLDPQARRQLWALIDEARAAGRTVVLTTHYMDEAEKLCDRVAIVDHGKVIALGTPKELIASLGAQHVVVFEMGSAGAAGAAHGSESRSHGNLPVLAELAALPGVRSARLDEGHWSLQTDQVHQTVPALLGLLRDCHLELTSLVTHTATLEDLFVQLTGRHLRDG
jgi:ABC-2 type transport system ATP-binding protein